MVGRTDSLQTAPNLHDRMWELDGFGDYVKHSFHFQFIVRRRGITFTQMERNLERHSFCATKNAYGKRRVWKKVFSIFLTDFIFLHPACSWQVKSCFMPQSGVKATIMVFVMVCSDFKLTLNTYVHIHSILHHPAPSLTPQSINPPPKKYEGQPFLLLIVSICFLLLSD